MASVPHFSSPGVGRGNLEMAYVSLPDLVAAIQSWWACRLHTLLNRGGIQVVDSLVHSSTLIMHDILSIV